MGFFSWRTQDTDRSICNHYSSRQPFRVIMTDDQGNQWIEDNYEGYGVFGGKDFHILVDEMNGGTGDRERGIDLDCNPSKFDFHIIYPSLTENGRYYDGEKPEDCEYQGFFYYDDNEDEEWDDEDEFDVSGEVTLDDFDEDEVDWDEDDIDPAGGHGPGSHI